MLATERGKEKGFSSAELLIVVLIVAIIGVLSLPQIMASKRLFRFSSVQRQVVNVFREARQHAISQRKPITVKYDDPNKRMVMSGGIFGNPGNANNQIVELSGNGVSKDELVYGRVIGASTAPLGDGTNLTPLSSNAVEVVFQSDGSVIDASNNPQNRALFFYDTKTPADTAFAVSILGAGGRTKLWRYNSGANSYVE